MSGQPNLDFICHFAGWLYSSKCLSAKFESGMKTNFLKLISLVLIFGAIQTFASNKVEISSYSPVIPLFKGMEANPLLRIRISISAGGKSISLKSLSCTLNLDGLNSIEKIYVYVNEDEPLFSDKRKSISIRPGSTSFNIPLIANLKPGVHYIWLAAKLKDNANVDSKVVFDVKSLEDSNSKKYKVTQSGSNVKRLGLVLKKAGEGGVNTFRIPGIATTNTGTLIGVYDIR